jgi:hypothetical protein
MVSRTVPEAVTRMAIPSPEFAPVSSNTQLVILLYPFASVKIGFIHPHVFSDKFQRKRPSFKNVLLLVYI